MLVFVQTLCGSAQILLFFTVLNLIKKKRRTHTSDWTFHWHGLKRGETQGPAQHRVLTPRREFYTTANAVGSNCPGNLGGPEFSRVVYSSCLSHLVKKKHRLWIKKKKTTVDVTNETWGVRCWQSYPGLRQWPPWLWPAGAWGRLFWSWWVLNNEWTFTTDTTLFMSLHCKPTRPPLAYYTHSCKRNLQTVSSRYGEHVDFLPLH